MSNNVLITGANRGVGLALCQEYLSRGDNVFAVCRHVSDEIKALPVTIISGVDVASASDMEKLKQGIASAEIDILINNAGILRSMTFDRLDFDQIDEQFQVNAVAPLRVVQTLADNLKNGSKVAMITSRMGSIDDNTSGGSYGYRMSKAALNAAGKSLAVDFKSKGVSVALLHPGYVNTEMVNYSGQIEPDLAAERLAQRIDDLNLENTGSFWHSNGEVLPW
ncbi:SDR family oxidoreductase [Aliikangiella coralliicola]|uniref:SDR family oxidoreductase n=1 Tax=Aliikangiella coralliicola TaxID=2592383 RepID=A0A545U0A1_9GAMM|nr:SDR family oxidoreductase [Aliikangiella coralliicola]TQV82889.1 SDR family oxidoreductase [Aliikangiella coralliicola]